MKVYSRHDACSNHKRIDLAGILGAASRMASAEVWLVPNGWVWERMSSPQPTRDPGERVSYPSGVRGRAPAENGF